MASSQKFSIDEASSEKSVASRGIFDIDYEKSATIRAMQRERDEELRRSKALIPLVGTKRWLWFSVKGYNTSLPEEDITKALTSHFRSCGGVIHGVDRLFNPDADDAGRCAMVPVYGDDNVEEKVLKLDGSDLGGRKLAVKVVPKPQITFKYPPRGQAIFGSTVPGRLS